MDQSSSNLGKSLFYSSILFNFLSSGGPPKAIALYFLAAAALLSACIEAWVNINVSFR